MQPSTLPRGVLAPAAATLPAGIGQRVVATGVALTVNSAARAPTSGPYQRAAAGKDYVIADVTVETVDRDSAAYNPYYFRLRDADGYEYGPTLYSGDQTLRSGELRRGERARGTVSFEVPLSATGFVLSYAPFGVALRAAIT